MKELLAKYKNDATEIFSCWNSLGLKTQERLKVNLLRSEIIYKESCTQNETNKRDAASSIDILNFTSLPTNNKESSFSYNLHKPSKMIFLKRWFVNRSSTLKGHYNIDNDLKYNNIHVNLSVVNQELEQVFHISLSNLIK